MGSSLGTVIDGNREMKSLIRNAKLWSSTFNCSSIIQVPSTSSFSSKFSRLFIGNFRSCNLKNLREKRHEEKSLQTQTINNNCCGFTTA
jgi:hypothetical protein